MSDQTASFKVTLCFGDSDEKEVRRFVLPKSTLTSYSILRDKLQVVFQALKSQPFEVSWEDDEGDRVLISSDEELMIAMKEMVGDVYRLQVHVTKPLLADMNGSAYGGPLHSSVWCDVCTEEIKGFRYKCIQCPNYDLCAKCEVNQHHKEHFMVRIPDPIAWRPEFGHRLAHLMSKSARKHRGGGHCGDGRGKGNSHHHSCHYHDYGIGGQGYQIPQFFQHIFRNMWETRPAQPEQQGEAAAAPRAENNAGEPEDARATYLKTIGETVASLLDPLGIDVDIEVETNKDKNGKSKAKDEESDGKKISKDVEKQADVPKEYPKLETQAADPEEKNLKLEEKSSRKEKGESDSDEWTVINEDALPVADKPVAEKESSLGAGSKPEDHTYARSPKKTNSGDKAPTPEHLRKYPNIDFSLEEPKGPSPVHHPPVPHNVPFLYSVPSYPGHNVALHLPPHMPPPIPPPMSAPVPPPIPHPASVGRSSYPHHAPTPAYQQMSHPRPHINHAITLMTSMGFNNEGGWLTTLLEAVNGDVSKALDILQPVKK